MPELPEVETIRRALEKPLQGGTVSKVELTLPRLLLDAKPLDMARSLPGQTVRGVIRRGKYLILEFDRDTVVFHLGMTGQLTFAPSDAIENPEFHRTVTGMQKPKGAHPVDKHTHLVLFLTNGGKLMFRDPRTFGKILFISGHKWADHPRVGKLGPEPLDLRIQPFLKEKKSDFSSRPIKSLLLDQSFLAGVGNIYADEALFASGIHPRRLAKTLKPEERNRLMTHVKSVLKKGIKYQGTTFSDYRKPDGSSGDNYERLMAYGRGGRPCRRCGTVMKKTVVAQRGTVFCPKCQPLRSRQ